MAIVLYRSRPGVADPLCVSTVEAVNQSSWPIDTVDVKSNVCVSPVAPISGCGDYVAPRTDQVVYCTSSIFHMLDATVDPAETYTLSYGTIPGGLGSGWWSHVALFGISNEGLAAFLPASSQQYPCPGFVAGLSSLTCEADDELSPGLYSPRSVSWNSFGLCAAISLPGYPPGHAFPVRSTFWWGP